MNEIIASFETMRRKINEELEQQLPLVKGPLNKLYEAARYAVLGAGKRLRPLIVLTCCTALKGNERVAFPAACALEMIHAYSLIHDDLPCMDDDDFRRGKPTLHRAYTEAHAVLTGDFLLTKAFEIVAMTPLLSAYQKVDTICVLAQKSADKGMLGGQVLDIEAEGKLLGLNELTAIHKGKTGALIAGACACGAIAAGSSTEVVSLLESIGEKLGTAFQIIDDVLDVTASDKKHGSCIASDQRNKKTTYTTLLGVEGSRLEAEKLLYQSLEQMQQLPGNTEQLRKLAEAFVFRQI